MESLGTISEDGQWEWNGTEWIPFTPQPSGNIITKLEMTVNKSHKKECIFVLNTNNETRKIKIKQKKGLGIGFHMIIDDSEPIKLGTKGLFGKSVSKVGLLGFKSETIHDLASDLSDVLVTIYWKNGLMSNSLYKVEFAHKHSGFNFEHNI